MGTPQLSPLNVCDTTINVMARESWCDDCDPKAHKIRESREHKQSKTNAQRMHRKVCVETYHNDHNILSFDTVDDWQHKTCWMPVSADHNTICLTFLYWHLTNPFHHFVDVRHCFGLQETQAAFANARPNVHSQGSKLGASQSFSREMTRHKPDTRYLLKPIILIIIYYHSTLLMTDSIRPAGCPPITTVITLLGM